MTAPDLHPEDLLDRAAAGTLSPEERSRLDAHLAVCPACRFEHQARADFAALPGGGAAVDDLVTRALAGLPTTTVRPVSRPRVPVGLVAAIVALVGFGSFAALRLAPPLAAMLGLSRPAPAPPEPSRRQQPPPSTVAAPLVLPPVPTPEATPPVALQPEEPRPARRPPAPAPAARAAHETPGVSAAEPITARSLFREATAARTAGDRPTAERLYREVATRFPSSPEATVAHAVLGRLLIDLGRPAEGLLELEATLDGGPSALREDALANRAQALDALGDDGARAAWEQLLREFPTSIHARRARERLEAPSAP
jgi:TolA-binding protein